MSHYLLCKITHSIQKGPQNGAKIVRFQEKALIFAKIMKFSQKSANFRKNQNVFAKICEFSQKSANFSKKNRKFLQKSVNFRKNLQIFRKNRYVFAKNCKFSQKICKFSQQSEVFAQRSAHLRKEECKLTQKSVSLLFSNFRDPGPQANSNIQKKNEFSRIRPKPNRVNFAHRFVVT